MRSMQIQTHELIFNLRAQLKRLVIYETSDKEEKK